MSTSAGASIKRCAASASGFLGTSIWFKPNGERRRSATASRSLAKIDGRWGGGGGGGRAASSSRSRARRRAAFRCDPLPFMPRRTGRAAEGRVSAATWPMPAEARPPSCKTCLQLRGRRTFMPRVPHRHHVAGMPYYADLIAHCSTSQTIGANQTTRARASHAAPTAALRCVARHTIACTAQISFRSAPHA